MRWLPGACQPWTTQSRPRGPPKDLRGARSLVMSALKSWDSGKERGFHSARTSSLWRRPPGHRAPRSLQSSGTGRGRGGLAQDAPYERWTWRGGPGWTSSVHLPGHCRRGSKLRCACGRSGGPKSHCGVQELWEGSAGARCQPTTRKAPPRPQQRPGRRKGLLMGDTRGGSGDMRARPTLGLPCPPCPDSVTRPRRPEARFSQKGTV